MAKVINILSDTGASLASVSAVHGPDSIVVKRLGWRRLEEAEKAMTKAAMAHVREVGMGLIKEIQQERAKGTDGDEPAAPSDVLASYDKATLLLDGIVSLDGAAKSPDAIDDLEHDTATETARAILKLSRPQLFETEADQKNA